MEEFEIVIVGAGSAGCIVANQLISKTNFKVLLIEAGPSDNNPVVKIPLGYGMTFYNKKLNWNFYSKKQKNLLNREIYFPRGKIVGGSGSINAMIYARGLNTDYEEWSQNTNDIWSWSYINESFKEIEKHISLNDYSAIFNKIPVNNVSSLHHPILKNFFEAAKEQGVSFNQNLTSDTINQVGHYNINTRNGYRFTSSDGFLRPILNNSKLTLLKNCIVRKINFNQKKISSIEIFHKEKKIFIKPKIGIILCAGSIMTPYLLMHSGIGCSNDLKKFNIEVNIDSPQVGKNLQDHIGLDFLYKSKVDTLNKYLGRWPGRIRSVLHYAYNRSGPLSLSINQGGGYINWNSKNKSPNLHLYFNPLSYSINYKNKRPLLNTDKFNGFVIGFNSCRPKSKGAIYLSSNKFNDAPVIDPNYLDHYEDINDLKCAFDFIRKISNSLHLKKIIDKALDIDPLKSSDEELIDYFRKKSNSVYHPCGTCRMDNNIQNGVVSKRLKVHGVENLWIVDASVFPNITSGNINASVMMLANRATKLIIDDLNNNN